jgi:hypothetical protein
MMVASRPGSWMQARASRVRDRLAQATVRHVRHAQIVGEAAGGLVALIRPRPFGSGRSDPRASAWWVPVQSLLARRGLLGATSPEERAFCHWYARCAYQGRGAIVDLGSWLGSATLPLATGMTRRPRGAPTTRIQAYDRFVWEEWMSEFASAANAPLPYRPGDDFRPTLEHRLGPHLAVVDVHTADLCRERWTGEPIELVMVDAMKSWDLAGNILREWLTAVVPHGVILHQDFAHYYTPWIHLMGYRLREHFDLYYDIPHSCGVAFRLRRPFGEIDVAGLTTPDTYEPDEVTAAFEYSRSLVRADKHANITAAEAMFYVYTDDLERAQTVMLHARNRGLRGGDLDVVEQRLRDSRQATRTSLPAP